MARMLTGGVLLCLSAITCLAGTLHPRMTALEAVSAPPGYVDFCERHPDDCGTSAKPTKTLHMNAAKWQEVSTINTETNQNIVARNDLELFGLDEYWTIARKAGDCEDFVLLKKKRLEALGYPSSVLLITVVLDEKNAHHAVLTITTDTGDYVLDNRRDEILPFSSTGYHFIKRQSQLDPQRWVSLAATQTDNSNPVASPSP